MNADNYERKFDWKYSGILNKEVCESPREFIGERHSHQLEINKHINDDPN